MNPKIADLARLMQRKKEEGEAFILLLGAGASMSSGILPTYRLIKRIVDEHGAAIEGTDIRNRFARLWQMTTPGNRNLFLAPYLRRKPSAGYVILTGLIKEGYFDMILTLNYDTLLESALQDRGLRYPIDFITIIRGDFVDEQILVAARSKEPRVKILKLHGSLGSAKTFLFSPEEMAWYPEPIAGLVEDLTRKDIIICGYGFEDSCMVRAFSVKGGSIYCVDPAGPSQHLVGVMGMRKSADYVVADQDGEFDSFFDQLNHALHPQAKTHVPACNPFKFLDSYETLDREWFHEREKPTQELLEKINRGVRTIHVLGKSKVGKTSLLRAGVIANLDGQRHYPIYIRCSKNIEECLPQVLTERFGLRSGSKDAKSAVQAFAAANPEKHIVLVLDQFERVVRQFPDLDTQSGRSNLQSCFKGLCPGCENLTVIFVAVSDVEYLGMMNEIGADWIYLPRLDSGQVKRIIRFLTETANVSFEGDVIDAILKRYESKPDEFSLAHIQAICSILCSKRGFDMNSYEDVLKSHLEALNQAINECDVMSFVEDMPLEEQRALLCNMIRIVSPQAKREIAESLKDHFSELLVSARRREPQTATAGEKEGAAHGRP